MEEIMFKWIVEIVILSHLQVAFQLQKKIYRTNIDARKSVI